jgi:histidinol dehydrogenase
MRGIHLNKEDLEQYVKDSKVLNKLFHHHMESIQENRLKFLQEVDKAIREYFMYRNNVDLNKIKNVNNFKLNERFHCIESVACYQKDYYDGETYYLTVVDDPFKGTNIKRHGW